MAWLFTRVLRVVERGKRHRVVGGELGFPLHGEAGVVPGAITSVDRGGCEEKPDWFYFPKAVSRRDLWFLEILNEQRLCIRI